jgi:hypothetical protein
MPEKKRTSIDIAFPQADDLHLKLGVGACRLQVTPGAGDAWVTGTYTHPVDALPLKITQEGGRAVITQDYTQVFNLLGALGDVPEFDLAFGQGQPYMLTLDGGASEATYDLGGLPIIRLEAHQGAGKLGFDFSAPNPQEMSLLDIDAGAVNLDMRRLANANFAEMRLKGGAAAYQLDFGGTLLRNAHVRIDTGMSSVELRVPESTAVKITSEAVLSAVDMGNGFTKKEGGYWNAAALAGQTPLLTIRANVSVGSLSFRLA